MTRKRAEAEPETSQEQPTQPRPVDPQGREMDQWHLPYSGPARTRALAELERPDPNIDPEAWVSTDAQATGQTEQNNG
ncbi:MAG TPA: hypothetical protein VF463_08455 [Sphingobium sp.]